MTDRAEQAWDSTQRNVREGAQAVADYAGDFWGDATRLVRRPGHPCVLVDAEAGDGPVLRVLLGDRHLDVPPRLRPALEAVRDLTELTPAALADHLDPESRLVLCRRLVREGLLQVLA